MTQPATEWGKFYDEHFSFRRILDNIGAHAELLGPILDARAERVIEVGVGSGSMSAMLSHFVPNVVGVDNDKSVLAKAEETNRVMQGRAVFREADAFRLSEAFPAGAFQFALSQGLLEHFSDDEIRALVAQQAKVATTVLASIPSFWYPQQDFGNERLMKPEDWQRILEPLGLDVTVVPYGFTRNRKSFYRWRPFHLLITARARTPPSSAAPSLPK